LGLELIEKLSLADSQSLLDIGCGDGKLTACIAGKFRTCSITGIDISPDMVNYARERFSHVPNLHFIQMDASSMTFGEPFDMAFSATALHWIKDHQPVLQGLYRSLKPGAGVLMQMGALSGAYGLVKPAAEVILSSEYAGYFQKFDHQFSSYSADEYSQLLEKNGLRPIRVEILKKLMRHRGVAALKGFMRTTWMPYTDRVPEEKRESFIDAIIQGYLREHPAGKGGIIEIPSTRLEIEAVKP